MKHRALVGGDHLLGTQDGQTLLPWLSRGATQWEECGLPLRTPSLTPGRAALPERRAGVGTAIAPLTPSHPALPRARGQEAGGGCESGRAPARARATDGGVDASSQTGSSAGLLMRLDGLAGFVFQETPSPYPQKNREPECAREATHRQNIPSEERSTSQILIRLERA